MSTQGKPTINQSNQASDDELAAIYLRDRDVPCPSCDYNRRDGQSSTCPECGSALTLIGIDAAQVSNFTKLARSVLFYLWILAAAKSAYNLYILIRIVTVFAMVPRPFPFFTWVIGATLDFIVWLVLFIITLSRWRKSRHNETIASATVISPIVMIVIYTFLSIIWAIVLSDY
tara:strand:+ start:29759 stop:30277 length:519 start_codon:yes stop_codon:yes gene_type:complete